jgi:rare lipoprotein A
VRAQETTREKIDNQTTVVVLPDIFKTDETQADALKSETMVGLASYYAAKFHGKRTASGERYSQKLLTAAHLSLPFGTLLKVTNLRNMTSVIVRVNDRGPQVHGRMVDVSRAAAEHLGITRTGVARVELEILKPQP